MSVPLSNIVFAGYADDNTPYTYSSNIKRSNCAQQCSRSNRETLFSGFLRIVANVDNCHLASSETAVDTHISDPMVSYEKKESNC